MIAARIVTAFLGTAALVGAAPSCSAATLEAYDLVFQRTVADATAATFSGKGVLSFSTTVDDFSVDDPSEIAAFSLAVTTLGSLGEDDAPVAYTFTYGLEDVVSAFGIEPSSDPGGSISLATKDSTGGEVTLEGLFLDLDGDVASGFCFGAVDLAQCVRDGGSSTGIEARFFQELRTAPVPLPASLPLTLAAFGGLAAWRWRIRTAG